MVDTVSARRRSEIMGRVKGKDTALEMVVRRLVHGAGYRYRLHVANLPGRPDLVFPGRRKIIQVNGCFWHMHDNCPLSRMPKSRVDFWRTKLARNKQRDEENLAALTCEGWTVLTVWECEIRDVEGLLRRLEAFLEG
ncbi:DNA mismatch endonuclease Vsr [Duganella sp. LX47W]|uniref:Very short patch repair endonuclease n=2 Tax=Rugamonas apoptosis TaxID=2758570 RepID=A0A7W2ILY6_9BURK|nr:DNA mismatch endonuclease Vsr [Rugamonas apoptosis]